MRKENCSNCKHRRRLIHNFIPGEGWDDNSLCCIVFLQEGGPVYQTEKDAICQYYERTKWGDV